MNCEEARLRTGAVVPSLGVSACVWTSLVMCLIL
jgi:hypothetical protein